MMWGDKGYGQWVVALAWYQQITTFDLGLGMLFFRQASSATKESRIERSDQIWSGLFFWSFILFSFLLIVSWLLGLAWFWIFFFTTACLLLPIRGLQMLLNGREDLAWSHLAYMIGRLGFVGGVLSLWLLQQRELSYLVILFAVSQIVEGILLILFVQWRHPKDWPQLRIFSLAEYKQLGKEAYAFFLIGIASNLLGRVEPILMSFLFSYQVVAYYDLGFKLCMYFGVFCRQILNVWSPRFARSAENARAAILQACLWCGLVAWPCLGFALLHRDLLFLAWIGEAPPLTLDLFVWLLLGTWANVYQSILSNALALRGKQSLVARIVLWRGVTVLLFATGCGWLWGPVGYAIALFVVGSLWDIGYMTHVCAKELQISAKKLSESFFVVSAAPFASFWLAAGWTTFWDLRYSPKLTLLLHAVWEVGAFALCAYCIFLFLRRSSWNPSVSSPTSPPLSSKEATSF
jgi:O-antigen/teichoic acid export membrane protein